ncbi:MAG: hypothetical protein N0C81_18725 [Candidatus Thiodiazotropha lotti]|nr:hypothetical protein [Candidatus Thiodiazotropha lotti]MCG8001902.1 hypothetical protein [Candidatus Thiodiazotropha lotti]MCG8009662.1 hypothetical protein [Candidatus Thiodiazotropha lotti]MCW4185520.1 hypothetical protein [Candidatus Thiodiazotropha lotti]MCW4197255.1 hypothetical protein [Candidatus Thiodiazotropha lotti]
MKVYQISYDLRKQRNYEALYELIRNYNGYCHALESSWLITTQQSATQVRDYLNQALDQDDRLLVTRLQGEAAWTGLDDELSRWLKEQLSNCNV